MTQLSLNQPATIRVHIVQGPNALGLYLVHAVDEKGKPQLFPTGGKSGTAVFVRPEWLGRAEA